ncbi:hypothetical protein SY83_07525 [Paenibacillus swuensis]|uniref:EamA domain-containing protein n=1 Tax=Paenibacillus swuensis TaxID=1178515 RepID=A0A172TNZ4_9BACL|nr:hypothetical protein SY83_07525 [Paenibacillus swuensis]
MWFIAAIGSAVLFGTAGFFMKVSQMKQGSMPHMLLGLYTAGSVGFLVNAWVEGSLDWGNGEYWLAGLIIGVGSAFGNVVFMKALDHGPASLTSPLMNLNILVVVLLSTVVYHEPVGLFESIGVVLLLGGAVLLSMRRGGSDSSVSPLWFVLVMLAVLLFAIRNGGLKVTAALGLENTPILFISYFLSVFWFAFAARRLRLRGETTAITRKTGWIWGLLTGLFSYGGLQLYSLALQNWKASIVAPIFSANGLIMVLGSTWIYKERLTGKQKIALMLLLAGLITIRL